MPGLGLLKGLRLVKNVRTVSKVGAMAKVGTALKELPVVRIIAGSAVGLAVLDFWSDSKSTLSETLGVTEDTSGILIVVAAVAAVAVIVSLLRRRRDRWPHSSLWPRSVPRVLPPPSG